MARYGQAFKDKALARLLPPESAATHVVAQELGIGVSTLERWREQAHASPARGQGWHAGSRLDAVITTAALNEAAKSAWCRERGVYPGELDQWRSSCTTALSNPEEARASPQATRAKAQAHQGARTRFVAQRPGTGRDCRAAGAIKKSRGDQRLRERTNDRPR